MIAVDLFEVSDCTAVQALLAHEMRTDCAQSVSACGREEACREYTTLMAYTLTGIDEQNHADLQISILFNSGGW